MSALHFQKALALLIRLPEANRGNDLANFLAPYDLSEHERSQLAKLAADYNVQKFGRIMRGGRWQGFLRQLKILSHFVSESLLEEINQKYFEPTAATHRARYYPIEFMGFLVSDDRARAMIGKNAPEYVFDVIRYEQAQLQFRRQVFDTSAIGNDSLLVHQCFRVVDLDYDVPSLLKKLSQIKTDNSLEFTPEIKRTNLLMVGDLEVPDFRTFEIDEETAAFLEAQLEALRAGSGLPLALELPKSYGDLVELGLCKPITTH